MAFRCAVCPRDDRPASTGPEGTGTEPSRGNLSERPALIEALSELYVAGCPVDFVALHRGRGGAWDDVPLYPFERRRYWLGDFSAVESDAVK